MDKREAVRVPVQVRARCRTDGVVIDGLVEDVSRSGLFMRVDPNALEEGTEAELDLELPDETLHIPVEVVRVEGDGGVALKFAERPREATLANFIMKQHHTGPRR